MVLLIIIFLIVFGSLFFGAVIFYREIVYQEFKHRLIIKENEQLLMVNQQYSKLDGEVEYMKGKIESQQFFSETHDALVGALYFIKYITQSDIKMKKIEMIHCHILGYSVNLDAKQVKRLSIFIRQFNIKEKNKISVSFKNNQSDGVAIEVISRSLKVNC